MIHALISGVLFRPAEKRTAKSGKPYVVATVKVKGDEGSHFIRVTAFSESVQAELLQLRDGECVAAQGRLTADTYTAANGETQISFSIVAGHALALRQPPKKRAAKAPEPPNTRTKQERQRGTWTGPDDGPCDEIPF